MVTKEVIQEIISKYGNIQYNVIVTDYLPKSLFVIHYSYYVITEFSAEGTKHYNYEGDEVNSSLIHNIYVYGNDNCGKIVGNNFLYEIEFFIFYRRNNSTTVFTHTFKFFSFMFTEQYKNIMKEIKRYNLPATGISRYLFSDNTLSISIKDLNTLHTHGINIYGYIPRDLYNYKKLLSCSLIDAYWYSKTEILSSFNYEGLDAYNKDILRKDIRYCLNYARSGHNGTLYKDYINILDANDITNRKKYPRYPKNFSKVEALHDNLVQYLFDSVNNPIEENLDLKYQEEYYSLAKRLEYSNDKYSIIACKELKELIYEGRILEHCVGSYTDSVGNGREYILFLRKNDNIETPFYTVDVTPNSIVRQIHGKCNCNVIAELEPFIKEWASIFNLHISNYSGCKVHL